MSRKTNCFSRWPMITPIEIKQKAERLYLPFLRAWLRQESFFPQEIRFEKVRPSDDYMQIKEGVERLIKGSKEHLGVIRQ